MVISSTFNGKIIYLHTAWANDETGSGFSLEEFDGALFIGNYTGSSITESENFASYSWKRIDDVTDPDEELEDEELEDDTEDDGEFFEEDDDDDSAYLDEELENNLVEIEAAAVRAGDNIASNQQANDSGIGNANLLCGTNSGKSGYSVSSGFTLSDLDTAIYDDADEVKAVRLTCDTASEVAYLAFDSDYLLDKLSEASAGDVFTLSFDSRMSDLFISETLAVQDSDGTKRMLLFDQSLDNASDNEEIDNTGEWVHYSAQAVYEEQEISAQTFCISLKNMPAGSAFDIANLKIEEGSLETPWRQSEDEIAGIAKQALDKAQAAQATADEAAESASQANTLAEAAQASADQAKQSADAAQSAADNAQGAVDAVAAGVASLETSVDNAQKAADNAQAAADTAQAAADNAQQSADNAAAEAETAKTNAATAQTKAEEAAGSAASAQETADDAVSKANAAQVTANTARSEVAQANEEIDGLSTSLETTKQTLEADYSKKSDLSTVQASLQAQITENAAQIEITHSKVVEVDETANDAKEKAEAAQTAAGKAQTDATAAKTAAANAQTAADNAKTAADNAQSEADAAKTAATNARSVADKAQEDLEAAQADLAAVTGRVDATEEDIAAAQAAVTTAQAAADKAKQDAATAQTKAETAQTAADDAATKATNAQTKADEAKTAADDAALAAGKAQTDATAAKTAAANAQTAAETAQITANTAKANAATAQTKADQAATDAATAQSTADAAKTKAENAQTDLNTAKENLEAVKSRVDATEEDIAAAEQAVQKAQSKADEAAASAAAAQSTADTAKTNAATAQAAADEAKEDAAAAQTAADNAKTAADAAQADVNSLKTRVTKTETDIKKNADAIALTATKEEVTETLGGYYTKEEADAAIEVKADSITQTVSNTYATKQGLADANTQIETNKSQIEQTADRLKLLIKSGDTESSLVLTDKLIELAAAGINLKGLVSFSGLNSETRDKITGAQETANDATAKADLITGIVSGTDTFDISVSGSLNEESAQINIQSASESGKFTIPGEYTFSYSGSGWSLDGASVVLSDYGITLNGTAASGDTIKVVYDNSGLIDEIDELNKRTVETSETVGSLSDAIIELGKQTDSLSEATSKLQVVQAVTDAKVVGLAGEMEVYRGCVVIDGDEPSITVGAGSDAKTNLKITPEKMSFMTNGNEAASLSNDALKADSVEITNLYMKSVDNNGNVVGTLGWVARANGHLSLRVVE